MPWYEKHLLCVMKIAPDCGKIFPEWQQKVTLKWGQWTKIALFLLVRTTPWGFIRNVHKYFIRIQGISTRCLCFSFTSCLALHSSIQLNCVWVWNRNRLSIFMWPHYILFFKKYSWIYYSTAILVMYWMHLIDNSWSVLCLLDLIGYQW